MITRTVEQNPTTKKFHIVKCDENADGTWAYVRKSGGGLTLRTQNLDYYFHGIQEKGYKTEKYAQKKMEKIEDES